MGTRARPARAVAAAAQPAPKPPAAARPKRLSVTDIEDWLRDPYTIYAKYILRLPPLDAVDISPGAAERGTIIHNAIGDFTERSQDRLPADPLRELIELGETAFRRARRFSRGARLLVAALQAHRALVRALGRRAARRHRGAAAEIRGEIEIRSIGRRDSNARHRRPHRARRRRRLCHPRLQDRRRRAAKSRCVPGLRRS